LIKKTRVVRFRRCLEITKVFDICVYVNVESS
jgi:hypothetical protein